MWHSFLFAIFAANNLTHEVSGIDSFRYTRVSEHEGTGVELHGSYQPFSGSGYEQRYL
jgi:hypothetical protein